jgi:hypothetical protein
MSPLNHNLSYVDIVWVEQITNGKIHFCSFFRNFLEYILLDQIGKPTATLPSLVVNRGESYAHYQRVCIPFLPRYTRNRKELGGGSLFRPTFHHHSSKKKKTTFQHRYHAQQTALPKLPLSPRCRLGISPPVNTTHRRIREPRDLPSRPTSAIRALGSRMDAFCFVEPIRTAAPASPLTVAARTSVVGTRWRAHGLFARGV